MLRLRGHHLLCLQGFQGHGYDEEFTRNMEAIYNIVMKHNESIRIVSSMDDICKCCPNNVNDMCIDSKENSKIIKMDNLVLDRLNSRIDMDDCKPDEVFDLINNELFTKKDDIKDTCLLCKWYDVCLWAKGIQ